MFTPDPGTVEPMTTHVDTRNSSDSDDQTIVPVAFSPEHEKAAFTILRSMTTPLMDRTVDRETGEVDVSEFYANVVRCNLGECRDPAAKTDGAAFSTTELHMLEQAWNIYQNLGFMAAFLRVGAGGRATILDALNGFAEDVHGAAI